MGQFTLTNEFGETTSHISGLFYRTIRMMVAGLKPVYVFDGKPPELKSGEVLHSFYFSSTYSVSVLLIIIRSPKEEKNELKLTKPL